MQVRTSFRASALRLLVFSLVAGAAGSCGGGGDVSGPPDDPPGPPAVASVEVTPTAVNVAVGQSSQLSATPRSEDGTALSGRTIAWATADEAVATVDETGMVTAVAAGEVEVSATSEGKRGVTAVTVSELSVASVEVVPDPSSVAVGRTAQLTVLTKAAGGEELPGRPVTWATSDPAIASVSETGVVTGVAVGEVAITATSEGQTGMSRLTVSAVAVATVEVDPATASIARGGTLDLTAIAKDGNGTTLPGRPATWSSSNTGVARVNATGTVTGSGSGTATITATVEGKTGTAEITVTARPVATVEVTPASPTVVVGRTVQLTASAKDADGNVLQGRTVTWTVSDAAVATVSGTGLVRGIAAGSATITATSEGKSGTASVTVTPPTGTVRTWKGGASGGRSDWALSANWDPRGTPIALDSIRVPEVANGAVLSEDAQVAHLVIKGGSVRTAGHVLTVKARN